MDKAVREIAVATGDGAAENDDQVEDEDEDEDDEPISHCVVPAMALSGHLAPRCSWPHKLIFHPCYLPLARPQPLPSGSASGAGSAAHVCGAICTVGPKSRALTLFNVLGGATGGTSGKSADAEGSEESESSASSSLWSLRSRGNVGGLDLGALACTEDDGSGGGGDAGGVGAAGNTCLVAAAQVTRGRDGAIAVLEVV